MSTVETVRGPVDAETLGRTLMHEHILLVEAEALANYSNAFGESYWDEEVRVADAIAKLGAVREAGINTLVDPTAPGLGRFIPRIKKINEAVDLNIIVASGLYAFVGLPNFLTYRSADAIAEIFIREIREGINDTGVKAAFLKCAVEAHGMVGDVPRILAAVGAAAVETGAPVMVHTSAAAKTGLPALEALTGAGVEPSRIVIAHMGDSNDMDYLRAVADTGAWLGLDRFGIDHFNPMEDRIRTMLALMDAGYGPQLHVSHDAACFCDFMTGDPFFAGAESSYLLVSETVVPALLAAGATPPEIDALMIENPRRFFAPACSALAQGTNLSRAPGRAPRHATPGALRGGARAGQIARSADGGDPYHRVMERAVSGAAERGVEPDIEAEILEIGRRLAGRGGVACAPR